MKKQEFLNDPLSPAYCYLTRTSFKFGDNVYINPKTGYVWRKKREGYKLGRYLFSRSVDRKYAFTSMDLMIVEEKLLKRLREADGKPENYAINITRDRII